MSMYLTIAALTASVIALNVWYSRRRKCMSVAERKVEDEESERELRIW